MPMELKVTESRALPSSFLNTRRPTPQTERAIAAITLNQSAGNPQYPPEPRPATTEPDNAKMPSSRKTTPALMNITYPAFFFSEL